MQDTRTDENERRPAVAPCPRGSAEYTAAADAIKALEKRVEALSPLDDPRAANAELERVLHMRCLETALELAPAERTADSVLSLRTFLDDGGMLAMREALQLAERRRLVFPPAMRRTLALEGHADHPLAADVLCSLADQACGHQWSGFRIRAERVLQQGATSIALDADDPVAKWHRAVCFTRARGKSEYGAFDELRRCLAQRVALVDSFPLGVTRAPTEGFLVIRGRRGHHAFCDGLRAYDLATGAVHAVASCGRLALEGPMVDHRATDATRRLEDARGFVFVDNLREAAWMMVLGAHMQPAVAVRATQIVIPDDISLVSSPVQHARTAPEPVYSSGVTTLAWTLVRGGRAIADGHLKWYRDPNRPASAYAAELLRIAEESFVAGCPRSAPPLPLPRGHAAPGVSFLDADVKSLTDTERRLEEAMAELERAPCKPGPDLPATLPTPRCVMAGFCRRQLTSDGLK